MLIPGTNSFVTSTEANDYMNTRYGASGWFAISTTDREALLIDAFRWLVSEGVPKNSMRDETKWAQVELAWYIYRFLEEHEKRESLIASGVTDFKLSKWREKLSQTGLPQRVKEFASKDLQLGGGFSSFNRTLQN